MSFSFLPISCLCDIFLFYTNDYGHRPFQQFTLCLLHIYMSYTYALFTLTKSVILYKLESCTMIDSTESLAGEWKGYIYHRFLLEYMLYVQNQYLSRLITSNQIRTITLYINRLCKSSRQLKNNLSSNCILDPGQTRIPEHIAIGEYSVGKTESEL